MLLGLVIGYMAWTLTEYFGHRYLFHTVFALPFGLGPRFQFLIHGVHHIYPNDPLRLVMPPLLSAPIMLIALPIIRLLFGASFALAGARGLHGGLCDLRLRALLDASRPAEVEASAIWCAPAHAAPLPRRRQGFRRACHLVGLCVRHRLSKGDTPGSKAV